MTCMYLTAYSMHPRAKIRYSMWHEVAWNYGLNTDINSWVVIMNDILHIQLFYMLMLSMMSLRLNVDSVDVQVKWIVGKLKIECKVGVVPETKQWYTNIVEEKERQKMQPKKVKSNNTIGIHTNQIVKPVSKIIRIRECTVKKSIRHIPIIETFQHEWDSSSSFQAYTSDDDKWRWEPVSSIAQNNLL